MPKKKGLGLGLGALFDDNKTDPVAGQTLRLNEIEPNREQPRKNFDDESISSLADSIKQHGILQPLLVRPYGSSYQIVAGERRWRAARMAGLEEVPVNIRELSDSETMQIAVIENLQRENLNPVEEALGYNELIEKYGMTQEKVAKMVGKSRSSIANSVRILSLPQNVLKLLEDGRISTGHAKALLSFGDKDDIVAVANKAADGGMTVRQVEKLVQKYENNNGSVIEKTDRKTDSYFVELELSLKERLGRKVRVDYGKNKGVLVLEFYDKEDLSAIAEKLVSDDE